jgi:hypothetical protein
MSSPWFVTGASGFIGGTSSTCRVPSTLARQAIAASRVKRELGFTTSSFDEGWRETLLHEQRLMRGSGGRGRSSGAGAFAFLRSRVPVGYD